MGADVVYAQDPYSPSEAEIQFSLQWLDNVSQADMTDDDMLFAAMLA